LLSATASNHKSSIKAIEKQIILGALLALHFKVPEQKTIAKPL
jgi:hypothetical protein